MSMREGGTTVAESQTDHHVVGKRRRPSESEDLRTYRHHFFCDHIGRCFRSSKRRISWSFGFLHDIELVEAGKRGVECRKEVHEVDLIWSVKSGKTRLYWNGRNISNLCPEESRHSMVELSWKTTRGESLQIVAHADGFPGVTQYDLLIDGTSFFRLPTFDELSSPSLKHVPSEELEGDVGVEVMDLGSSAPVLIAQSDHITESASTFSENESIARSDLHPQESMGYRLSMAGLLGGVPAVQPIDELHSELYSSKLESLRFQVTACLPQTEEIISRAIIRAFFPDTLSNSGASVLSLSSTWSDEKDPQQLEVDTLLETCEWTSSNVEFAPRPDAEENALSYFQRQTASIFSKVRNEELSSHEAARILLGVAAILGLKFASHVPVDTFIIKGMDRFASSEELRDSLTTFGDLEATAVATRDPTFGFCRFLNESCGKKLTKASEDGLFSIGGTQPSVIALTDEMHNEFDITDDVRDANPDETSPCSSPVPLDPVRSLSSEIVPHLMGPLTSEEEELDPEFIGSIYNTTPDQSVKMYSVRSPTSVMADLDTLVPTNVSFVSQD